MAKRKIRVHGFEKKLNEARTDSFDIPLQYIYIYIYKKLLYFINVYLNGEVRC